MGMVIVRDKSALWCVLRFSLSVCVGVFVRLVVSLFVPILLLHHHHLLLLSLCIYPKQT